MADPRPGSAAKLTQPNQAAGVTINIEQHRRLHLCDRAGGQDAVVRDGEECGGVEAVVVDLVAVSCLGCGSPSPGAHLRLLCRPSRFATFAIIGTVPAPT